ncbi:MAG TPA: hypothetical protein VGW78_00245 [Candidatus Babeliales bacterium]|jgi:hypothetical protein|nr:hypothetical protein [Candidatus Babeliales bacterium]
MKTLFLYTLLSGCNFSHMPYNTYQSATIQSDNSKAILYSLMGITGLCTITCLYTLYKNTQLHAQFIEQQNTIMAQKNILEQQNQKIDTQNTKIEEYKADIKKLNSTIGDMLQIETMRNNIQQLVSSTKNQYEHMQGKIDNLLDTSKEHSNILTDLCTEISDQHTRLSTIENALKITIITTNKILDHPLFRNKYTSYMSPTKIPEI